MFEDGTSSTPLTVPVAAQRRANVSVANQIPASNGRRFSILVESIGGEPVPLVVERSTYTSPGSLWRAGSNESGHAAAVVPRLTEVLTVSQSRLSGHPRSGTW